MRPEDEIAKRVTSMAKGWRQLRTALSLLVSAAQGSLTPRSDSDRALADHAIREALEVLRHTERL